MSGPLGQPKRLAAQQMLPALVVSLCIGSITTCAQEYNLLEFLTSFTGRLLICLDSLGFYFQKLLSIQSHSFQITEEHLSVSSLLKATGTQEHGHWEYLDWRLSISQ